MLGFNFDGILIDCLMVELGVIEIILCDGVVIGGDV